MISLYWMYEPAHMKRAQLQKNNQYWDFCRFMYDNISKSQGKRPLQKMFFQSWVMVKMYTLVKMVLHSSWARVITEFDIAFTPESIHILSWNFNTQNSLCKRRNWVTYQEHTHTLHGLHKLQINSNVGTRTHTQKTSKNQRSIGDKLSQHTWLLTQFFLTFWWDKLANLFE